MSVVRAEARPLPGAAAAPVIEVADVSLTFATADGPIHALAEVSLTIAAGDFVSFIGPSGCGKTTLLRAIADLEQPTAGADRKSVV